MDSFFHQLNRQLTLACIGSFAAGAVITLLLCLVYQTINR